MDSTEERYYFTEATKQIMMQMNPEQRKVSQDSFFFYMNEYKKFLKQYDPITVYKNFLDFVEEENKFSSKGTSCGKGCNFCCYLNVDSFDHEVQYIAAMLEETGIQPDMDLLKKQAEAKEWNDLPYKDRKCCFLGEKGECKIYDFRPLSCRKYYVVTPSEECNSEIYPEGIVGVMTYNHAELVTSALLNCAESGRFQTMLYSKLKK